MIIRFDDPVQQEIWATIRALNDAWTKGNPDDLANYFHRTKSRGLKGDKDIEVFKDQ